MAVKERLISQKYEHIKPKLSAWLHTRRGTWENTFDVIWVNWPIKLSQQETKLWTDKVKLYGLLDIWQELKDFYCGSDEVYYFIDLLAILNDLL